MHPFDMTVHKYKKKSLGRHRGALVALEMYWESSGTILNNNSSQEIWLEGRRAHYDVNVMMCCSIGGFWLHQKSTKGFFMNEIDYFGTSEDLKWWMTRDQRWKTHSRLDCGIWLFRLENITDLKTTFCGD